MSLVRRKVFISHYKGDRKEVDAFIDAHSDVFIPKILGANDNDEFINSTNTDYVMQRIRENYLEDSTVTIVLLGPCTHSRRYVDWEIKSSLQQGKHLPNGLMGLMLPSQKNPLHLPERFSDNWKKEHVDCYARCYSYPSCAQELSEWIEDAFKARTTRSDLINNTLPKKVYNSKCMICEITHQ